MRKLGLVLPVAALFAFGCGGDDDDDAGAIDAAGGGAIDAAADTTYTVTLTNANEVGSTCTAAPPAAATGTAMVTINAAGTQVAVTLSWSGLSGAATAAHIHANVAGMNGGVALAFAAAGTAPTSPVTKTFTTADFTAPMGGPADFAALITAMKAGGTYVNVHTANCPMGEIRGQIE